MKYASAKIIPIYFVAPFAGAWIEILLSKYLVHQLFVAPFAGAWIEIVLLGTCRHESNVAPFAGAWIEIVLSIMGKLQQMSLPSRERGLKSPQNNDRILPCTVAPFAGAWIEMSDKDKDKNKDTVAPFAGAWIEISEVP